MTPRLWGLLLLLSLLWGGSFMFINIAVQAWPPLTVVLSRVVLASALLWLLAGMQRQRLPLTRPVLLACLGMSLLNNLIPFILIAWAQQSISSSLASVVNAATPVLTALVAHVATRDEKLTGPRLGGVLLGLAGVAVLAGPAAFAPDDGSGAELPGILAGLGACLSYAMAAVWGRRFRRLGVAPLPAAAGQTSTSILLVLPLVLWFDAPWNLFWPDGATLLVILALGLLSTGLAYALFFRILAEGGATNSALVTQLVPVTAILLGVIVLGEALLPRHLAGMVLIAGGFALLDGRLSRRFAARLRRPSPP
ncbi:DMT family transporter [Teichococcus oryzae]|uniref:DMT family transporter n=1 Tax=Teichococcus oryzae TaxID=1608942 RepID=A0A5B2TFY5_9PROT|nr:DMT family transporter [Pseudoroseomonas oryzae]KAA2213079.1 DMT family transporter [Pseudoroseomonas oryzae]